MDENETIEEWLDRVQTELRDAERFIAKGDKKNALDYLRSAAEYAEQLAARAEDEWGEASRG